MATSRATPSGTTVFVKGFSSHATPEDLADLFRACGKVKKVAKSGSGEYAYVEYEDHEGARAAVRQMNGIQFDGDSLTVELKDEAPSEPAPRRGSSHEPYDTRTCHNCRKAGHIARNCPNPPRDPRYLDTRGTRRADVLSSHREREEPYRSRGDLEARRYEERLATVRPPSPPPRYRPGGASPPVDSADYKLFQEFLEFKKRMVVDGRDPYGSTYPGGYERPRADYATYDRADDGYPRSSPAGDYRYAAPPPEPTFTVRVPSSHPDHDYRRGGSSSYAGRPRDYPDNRVGYVPRERDVYDRHSNERYPPRGRDYLPRDSRR